MRRVSLISIKIFQRIFVGTTPRLRMIRSREWSTRSIQKRGTSLDQIERFYARNLPLSRDMAINLQSFAELNNYKTGTCRAKLFRRFAMQKITLLCAIAAVTLVAQFPIFAQHAETTSVSSGRHTVTTLCGLVMRLAEKLKSVPALRTLLTCHRPQRFP